MPFTVETWGRVRVTVNLDLSKTLETIQDLEERLSDPTPLWNHIGLLMRNSFRRNFQQGGRPPWVPLSPNTVSERAGLLHSGALPRRTKTGLVPKRLLQQGQYGSTTILIRSGELRDSWVQKGAKGHVEQVEGNTFFVGSQLTVPANVNPGGEKNYHILSKKSLRTLSKGMSAGGLIPLARFHEEGTTRMPARQVAVLQDDDRMSILTAISRWAKGEELIEG